MDQKYLHTAPHKLLDLVPGNRTVYNRLRKKLAEGEVVAFVGEEASVPMYPRLREWVRDLILQAVREGKILESEKEFWLSEINSNILGSNTRLKNVLSDRVYHQKLYDAYNYRRSEQDTYFSQTQSCILRMNCKGALTTSFDPGLLEARRLLRPEIEDTRYTIWNQSFNLGPWLQRTVFEDPGSWPLLYLNGLYLEPENLLTDRETFKRAYTNERYLRCFENLFLQETLFFVGYNTDGFLFRYLGDQVFDKIIGSVGINNRHFVLSGLKEGTPYSPEMRRRFLDVYNAEVIFYRYTVREDGTEDHSMANQLLESLTILAAEETTLPTPRGTTREPQFYFAHKTTEDDKFTGREDDMQRLSFWMKDPRVKIVAITGLGGQGKTSLVAYWMRHRLAKTGDWEGFFYWSYYGSEDTHQMLVKLYEFAEEKFHFEPHQGRKDLIAKVHQFLDDFKILVVLDGLEVVQEVGFGTQDLGRFKDLLLFKFLDSLMNNEDFVLSSKVVLTSRIPFSDLRPKLGDTFRSYPLPPMTQTEGANLLSVIGVKGTEEDRRLISREFRGYPLMLRVAGAAVLENFKGEPTDLWSQVYADAAEEMDYDGKVERLMKFYDDQLTPPQRQAMRMLSLLAFPVRGEVLEQLWKFVFNRGEKRPTPMSDVFDELYTKGMVTIDRDSTGALTYVCHPVFRDFFKISLLEDIESSLDAAEHLGERPGIKVEATREDIQLIMVAIEIFLAVERIKRADHLYYSHFRNGRIFLDSALPKLGVETARKFVLDEQREKEIEQILGSMHLGFYQNEVGLFADLRGEPLTSLEAYAHAEKHFRKANDKSSLSIVLHNTAAVRMTLGELGAARQLIQEALDLTRETGDLREQRNRLWRLGIIASLEGEVEEADQTFAFANNLTEKWVALSDEDLYLKGVGQMEHLVRTGNLEAARSRAKSYAEICITHNWVGQIARCERVLGWIETLLGNYDAAEERFQEAEKVFSAGHLIYDLISTQILLAECHFARGATEASEKALNHALQLISSRQYNLLKADAYLLMTRLLLKKPEINLFEARDFAETALQLAEPCGYAWAVRDAATLLAGLALNLDQTELANKYQLRVSELNRRLRTGRN